MATKTLKPQRTSARHTTVALKTLMAATGLIMIGFLLAHMYGNTKAFISAQAFDDYAHHLRVLGEPILPETGALWIFRLVLLAAIGTHVVAVVKLSARKSAARHGSYAVNKPYQQSFSSKTMLWGGITILLFVVFHILQLTTQTIQINGAHESPYNRMVAGFENPAVSAFYILALAMVGFHVTHGLWSSLQTLGVVNSGNTRTLKTVSTLAGVVVFVGFASVPVAVLVNILERTGA